MFFDREMRSERLFVYHITLTQFYKFTFNTNIETFK